MALSSIEARLSSAVVVPFGKYKGQTIAILAQDKEYTTWLLRQTWFRQHKIYQSVVAEINGRCQTSIGIPKVYFVVNDQLSRMKIGTSVNPKKRLSALQTGNADTLVIYGTVLGDRSFEKQLHVEFAAHRLTGEWFKFLECKTRIDEILGRDREIQRNKTYSVWEFRLITGLTEAELNRAEWLAAKAGIGSYGCSGGSGNTENPACYLRTYEGNIRGSVWLRIVESRCFEKSEGVSIGNS